MLQTENPLMFGGEFRLRSLQLATFAFVLRNQLDGKHDVYVIQGRPLKLSHLQYIQQYIQCDNFGERPCTINIPFTAKSHICTFYI